jgi:glycosyltransferase involved in cell wall biosynthesis
MSTTTRKTIAHIIDDASLGGVTRMLDALIPGLGHEDKHLRIAGRAGSLIAPSMAGVDVAVLHATVAWSKLPFLISLRARMGQRPIVIVEHSYTGALERELVTAPNRFRCMLRLAYRFADRVVSVSEGQAHWMRAARLVPETKLVVIPPVSQCAALQDLTLPTRRMFSTEQPLRLGACGRFCAQKGFHDLLAAMSQLHDAPVHLTLAGYGPDEPALRQQAAGLSNVEIAGPFTDPDTFLERVDAVVLPSLWEAYGLMAMEARLAGRALIVTDVDGLPEQVRDARGLIVPAHSPAALADAIRTLCRRDLAIMGADARASARHHLGASLSAWSNLLSDLSQPQSVRTVRPTPHVAT